MKIFIKLIILLFSLFFILPNHIFVIEIDTATYKRESMGKKIRSNKWVNKFLCLFFSIPISKKTVTKKSMIFFFQEKNRREKERNLPLLLATIPKKYGGNYRDNILSFQEYYWKGGTCMTAKEVFLMIGITILGIIGAAVMGILFQQQF